MKKYSLRFATDKDGGERTVRFYANSTANALELAKESAQGGAPSAAWAILSEDDLPICRLKLMEETGVWLVEPTKRPGGEDAQ